MELEIHQQILAIAFGLAVLVGAVANKTNFCTMGAVSDWVNMGDTGRLRSWFLAIAVAMLGVVVLEASGKIALGSSTFPPYRTTGFAWLRYLLGGFMFGIGMTLASGCGNKTLVRIGAGNLKSLVVLAIAAVGAYLMLWTGFYDTAFNSWIAATSIDLAALGKNSQALGDLTGLGNTLVGGVIAVLLLVWIFASKEFRGSFDNILGGLVFGLAVVAVWYVTAGPMGGAWKEWADFAEVKPLRVEAQSYTFISPMGDGARYLLHPSDTSLINVGIMALAGVVVGSLLFAVAARRFRIEWFANFGDFANHAVGGVLMGIGGVLAMGCTVGQGITGVSTLAAGSMLALGSIIAGAAVTMKVQYWRMMREA